MNREAQMYRMITDGDAAFRERADRDTDRYRKGSFALTLCENGSPLPDGTAVEVHLAELDFRFGANIFMLQQYDTGEENRRYEEKFTGLFNAAAIPLYWEGTEPRRGYLRYAADTPNDVYRRPPADLAADFCSAHGIRMKGHPLFWHEFVPSWLPEDFGLLKYEIERRFSEISSRYARRVERFDVVNEPSRIYDVAVRDRKRGAKYIVPEDDYCVWMFRLARQYFPANILILNDTVGASFHEFRGKYSGYYLNCKDLLSRGVPIDEIGMQCHLGDRGGENVYNAERLYDVLDTYAALGKPLNISEISIPSVIEGREDEELQALAAERLYRVCFSHPAMTGITWWNLPDDGVLTTKRKAGDENLPSTGLLGGDYHEKAAYKTLKKLIKEEWRTDETCIASSGRISFRGYYGDYILTVIKDGKRFSKTVHLGRTLPKVQYTELTEI